MNRIILILLMMLLPGVSVFGATFYVATTGSDSNPGTQSQPWRTIQHAANMVHGGDTVIVEDGAYAEAVSISTGGTSEATRVTFQSHNKWRAKIAPTSTQGNSNIGVNIGANYVTVQDFEVSATTTTAEGIKCNGVSNCKILGNNVHDVGVSTTTCTSGAGIENGSSSDNNTISGNYIWNIGPPRTASFRCNQQHGIYIGGGINLTVQNNIIFEVWQGYALHINSETNLTNEIVTDNTVINVGDSGHASGGPFVLDCHATCDNNDFNDNLFANAQGVGNCFREIQESGATIGTHNLYQNNLLFNCGTNLFVTGVAQNTVTANPNFVNYTGDQNGDYSLAGTSPAISAGTSTGAPTVDFNRVARPFQGAWSIGAYEFTGGVTVPPAPTGLTATVQ
jgi:hypothetical protein